MFFSPYTYPVEIVFSPTVRESSALRSIIMDPSLLFDLILLLPRK
jgi:hypothetical protein